MSHFEARGRFTVAYEMASGDRAARAAICDLLEVTRQVMKPVAENGTHWCAEVAPKQMVEWCLSELAEVEEEIERAEQAELAAKRRTNSPDAPGLRRTNSRRRRDGVIEGRRTEDALFITPEKRESEPIETDAEATTPSRALGDAEETRRDAQAEVRAGTDPALSLASVRRSRARVKDELGDLLFDVLMLACVCERRFGDGDLSRRSDAGVTVAGAAAHAAQKVKRRCPHVFGPLPGPAATRAEEEAEWKKAKAIEKAAVAAGAALPPAPPTRRRHARFARLFSALADEPEALLAAASAGTCLGVVLGALMWRRHG